MLGGTKKPARKSRFRVAGAGLEPATFGLWAQRATTAPPRDVISTAKLHSNSYISKF